MKIKLSGLQIMLIIIAVIVAITILIAIFLMKDNSNEPITSGNCPANYMMVGDNCICNRDTLFCSGVPLKRDINNHCDFPSC